MESLAQLAELQEATGRDGKCFTGFFTKQYWTTHFLLVNQTFVNQLLKNGNDGSDGRDDDDDERLR